MTSHETELEDQDPPLEPPSAERVARRALVLAAVICRADIEQDAAAEEFRKRVWEWVTRCALVEELEPAEAQLLMAPIGELGQQEWIDASWRSPGLAVLAWALGGPLAPYDEQVEVVELGRSLGFLQDEPAVLQAPSLRSPAELEAFAAQMFALHWRLREFSIAPKPMDFSAFAQTAWFGPLDLTGLRLLEGDLAIGDEPIFRSDRLPEAFSLARERHQAANWLLGDHPIYSEVDTAT